MDVDVQILQATRRAFGRKGLQAVSMRGIAREVGITPMEIYRHYENKQALVDAVVLDALNEWSRLVAAIPPAAPLDWLRELGEAPLDFALLKPRRYEAAFLIQSSKARRYPHDFIAGKSPSGALQLILIAELISLGVLRNVNPIEIVILNAALSQGLITLYRAGRIAGGEPEFRELYLRTTERSFSPFLVGGHE